MNNTLRVVGFCAVCGAMLFETIPHKHEAETVAPVIRDFRHPAPVPSPHEHNDPIFPYSAAGQVNSALTSRLTSVATIPGVNWGQTTDLKSLGG
jgi:hypothetical protein